MDSEMEAKTPIETQDLWEHRSYIDGFNIVRWHTKSLVLPHRID